MARHRAFVVVAPGLEPVAVDELRALGVGGRMAKTRGGVEVELTTRQLYAIHRLGRVPTRVLVRLATDTCRRFDELERLVASVDWDRYLPDGASVAIHVASQSSALYHEGAIAERVVAVLGRHADDGGRRVHIRLSRDRATVSVDATGESMHRRGWRTAGHAAPLRATIAAAMLRVVGHVGSMPLIDPMAGSGTIAIEAASIALRRPIDRPFAFQDWPSFERGTWASVCAPLPGPGPEVAPIVAADRDAGAVATAREHAAAAGVADAIRFEHAALGAQEWPGTPALVVCNPPYGRRLGDTTALRDLYAALGRRVADGGHRLCVLAADDRLAAATGLTLEERFATTNGGIPVRCLVSE
jgi:putative N6-adenine-specific DNA methylase